MADAPQPPPAWDPAVFTAGAVDAETREFNRRIERALAAAPPLYRFRPQQIRDARAAGHSIFGPIRRLETPVDRTIEGPAGPLPIRVYTPEEVRGVYLHFHGGGFMLGTVDQHDEMLDALSRRSRLAVVTVGYRLAPENPYPAAPDDCEAAALWLAGACEREFGTRRLLVGGESAGANLAAVTLLRLRNRHGLNAFCGAALTYGIYDLTLTPSARNWGERYLILDTPTIGWFNDNYVPEHLRQTPDVSPLYADLGSLPPALFVVGTCDPLLDDTLFMHARWLAAGNPAELAVFPGGIHAFNFFPTAQAAAANRRIADFLAALAA